MQVDGSRREFVNEAIARINRIAAGVEQAYQPARAPDPDQNPEENPERGDEQGDEPEGDNDRDGDFEMENVRWEA
jgi:hypothetical protein